MRGNNVFIAFPNKNTGLSVAKMLSGTGYNLASVVTTGAALKESISYYGAGIIICGCKFSDMYIIDLLEDIPDSFNIILIGSRDQLEHCDWDGAFKLAVPLQRTDLVCSVSMFINIEEGVRGYSNDRKLGETKIIGRAKRTLMSTYSMSEEQAHRYMQKKSMDTGKKMVDIARIILSQALRA